MNSASGDQTRRARVEGLRRRSLLRDVFVFQGKLLIDALKDLILSPLSLVAAVIDLSNATPRRRSRFAAVMRAGRSFERRLDLFGDPHHRGLDSEGWTVDDLVDRFEATLREQAGEGGIHTTAREALDRTLTNLGKHGKPR